MNWRVKVDSGAVSVQLACIIQVFVADSNGESAKSIEMYITQLPGRLLSEWDIYKLCAN